MVRTVYKLEDVPETRRGFTLVWQGNPVLVGGCPCGSLNLFEAQGTTPAETARHWSELLGFRLIALDDLDGTDVCYRCGTQEVHL